ncbi:MAG: nitrogen regulation protein NR(II) [Gammaproteobacteria bacterium]|nr:nitrogen regulation protein NR(II) [Gammaproteobacteria bacterium]
MAATDMSVVKVYPAIIENLNAAVLLLDGALKVTYLNPAAEMLLALSARQARGLALSDLLPEARAWLEALKRALVNQHPYTEREVSLRLPGNQEPVVVDSSVTPLSNHKLLVELLRVDQHLRVTREETRLAQYQANRAVLKGLAHEINNPLGGLRGAAQLLERELASDTLKEYTRVIIGEADRLQNLLKRMLTPGSPPQRRRFNIHEALERVRSLVLAETHQGVEVRRDYDPSLPELSADPEQLIQALLNIARNAAQALGGKGVIRLGTRIARQCSIGHKRHRLVARVTNADNGPGIPAEIMGNIFYPMVSGRAGGTGLGLAIAQTLIVQHDGLIECASRPGDTVFTILLPLEN